MTENEIGLGKVFINSFSEFKFSDSLLSLSANLCFYCGLYHNLLVYMQYVF